MDSHRFDSLVKTLATRFSRRSALRAAGAGLAATAIVRRQAAAQEAVPATTPFAYPRDPSGFTPTSPEDREPSGVGFLFVQSFAGGAFAAKPDAERVYQLSLSGAPAETIYFSDRPQRVTGTITTQQFLDRIGFDTDAPNAALVIGGQTVVVELLGGEYDPASGTLTYDVALLADYQGTVDPVMAHHDRSPVAADEVPAEFGAASLFIDSADCFCCCNSVVTCVIGDPWYDVPTRIGYLTNVPFCGGVCSLYCGPCHNQDDNCNATFPECNGQCQEWVEYCPAAKFGC